MPELRTDWLTGRSVLVAENRALRPNEFAAATEVVGATNDTQTAEIHTVATCPFCAGNESRTPPSVFEQRGDDGRWCLRVVPNFYPAVNNLSGSVNGSVGGVSDADEVGRSRPGIGLREASHKPLGAAIDIGLQTSQNITGVHEVIIESADHIERMTVLTSDRLRGVVEAYVERLRHWREASQLVYGLVFKNQGPRAGASLTHVHSQLIALPFVPPTVAAEIDRATHRFQSTGRCAYCDLLDQERAATERVVFDRDGLVAFCPFASWQPHEVWLMPAEHQSSFELSIPAVLDRVAAALQQLFIRLEAVAPHVQYNLLLRTAPWRANVGASFHWRIELLPRTNSLAGLEVATGVHINPVPPERAALQLRAANVF